MFIDVNFDFTSDTPQFWDTFWKDELGKSDVDPDAYSPTLKRYQKVLWSKELPNGDFLNLQDGKGYLYWKDFRFGSDSITTSFQYKKNKPILNQIKDKLPNYKKFVEKYIKETYTIGGEILFPKMLKSINQMRGWNPFIKDRFDLTLECIRLYYKNQPSPLFEVLKTNKNFFDLFVSFKGYVDFFYLNDLVDKNYLSVKFWLGKGDLNQNPLPQTIEEYFLYLQNQINFVRKRNKRIEKEINKKP